jgi:Fe-S cluster assembly protein SufD
VPFNLSADGEVRLSMDDAQPFLIQSAACRLVFVNGRFAPELSDIDSLPSGVKAGSLAAEVESHSDSLALHLGNYLKRRQDPFSYLNTAFCEDGGYIHIARGTVLKAPIHLLFLSGSSAGPAMSHPRNLVIAEAETQADIVEEYASLDSGVVFSNAVTEMVAEENAVLSYCLIERESRSTFHVSTLSLHQERNANVMAHSVLVGGALVRNNVHPVLAGEGGECLINGLFIGDERQHLDNFMFVEHASPHCSSKQFYNGILGGNAHGVFHGRILVHKDAQKTDAKQTNRNLLLSDDAQIDTKPQLEIYADDVKCTHGATIGQVDASVFFYLRSRGLDEHEARALLLYAFAGECVDRIKAEDVHKHVDQIVRQSLPAATPSSAAPVAERKRWEELG